MTDAERYKSPKALQNAVQAAARKSGRDVQTATDDFYYDRFLERIFSEDSPSFVLKGGRGILARTVDARRTRDVDLIYREDDLEAAADELVRLSGKDMGDFLDFRFVGKDRIALEQEYREGYKLRFRIAMGVKDLGSVSVDLVAGAVSGDESETIDPAARLDIRGLDSSPYLVCTVQSAVADKACATMQLYNGYPSSRVKDLVDIVVYATTQPVDGSALSLALAREQRMRGMSPTSSFKVPDSWHGTYSKAYARLAKEANLPNDLYRVDDAEKLAKSLLDPALSGNAVGLRWDPDTLGWARPAC